MLHLSVWEIIWGLYVGEKSKKLFLEQTAIGKKYVLMWSNISLKL